MRTKYHFKAIITDKKGKVLSIGENSYSKSHPFMAMWSKRLKDPKKIFMHAEIHAIIKCKDLSKAKYIRIYRVHDNGDYELTKPCVICASAIEEAGLEVVLD